MKRLNSKVVFILPFKNRKQIHLLLVLHPSAEEKCLCRGRKATFGRHPVGFFCRWSVVQFFLSCSEKSGTGDASSGKTTPCYLSHTCDTLPLLCVQEWTGEAGQKSKSGSSPICHLGLQLIQITRETPHSTLHLGVPTMNGKDTRTQPKYHKTRQPVVWQCDTS